jgi:hypothetical protein
VRVVNGEIRAALSQPVRIIDWQDSNSSFFAAVQVERNVMFLILTLIIIVAAFNIISTLIMLVKDKGKDIAVLRTMGATSGSIMRIFLMCGAWIGVSGTLAGFRHRGAVLQEHREHPAVRAVGDRRRAVQRGDLLPHAAAGGAELERGGAGGDAGADPGAAGDDLPELARGEDGPGGDAAQ